MSKEKNIEDDSVVVAKKIEKENIIENTLFDKILVVMQIIFTISTFILLVTYIFNDDVMILLMISLGLCLLTVSATTNKFYKRKLNSIVYLILGLGTLLIVILSVLGVK